MPVLSMFYGVVIRIYFFDNKQHHVPHIHAEYADQKAVFSIESGQILTGQFPANKTRLVQAWIEIHREELDADWQLAVNGEEVFRIEPLKLETNVNPYVLNIEPLDNYCLSLTFTNGERRIFDIKPYLQRGVFSRLQNQATFRAARVVAGSVEWPGELDLSYDTLYIESKPVDATLLASANA